MRLKARDAVVVILLVSVAVNLLYFFGGTQNVHSPFSSWTNPPASSSGLVEKSASPPTLNPLPATKDSRDILITNLQGKLSEAQEAVLSHKAQAQELEQSLAKQRRAHDGATDELQRKYDEKAAMLAKKEEELQELRAEYMRHRQEAALALSDANSNTADAQAEQRQNRDGANSVSKTGAVVAAGHEAASADGSIAGQRHRQFTTRFDPATPPQTRIVYIKTHKTGSSTLTNMFHRFAVKYDLNVVLPKGNTFLGWPRSAGIPTSYVKIPGVKEYDIFCSAHTRYSRKYIEPIVPDAHYITIIRETTSHFKSSWNYWGVASHIKRVSGKDCTMEEFLEDPQTWFPRGLKGDKDLLENNFYFDLGFDHVYKEEEVDGLISHLDTFTMVLITEYMDESLVLMKRKLNWSLEDVLYYALKVNKRKPKAPMPADIRDKILKLNWVDNKIYRHFNETLWREIAKEKNFDEELAEYRRLKDVLSDQCAAWANWGEDDHRRVLLNEDDEPLSLERRHCHLAQMDSVAFVKYLKQLAGVPDPECATQGRPKRKVVYVKTHKTGSSTLTNLFHRYVDKHHLRPILPKDNLFLGWPNPSSLSRAHVEIPAAKGKYDFLCSAHSVYDPKGMEALVSEPNYVTVLRDPATHFISSWNYWHISDHIMRASGLNVTMDMYLDNPNKYRKHLSPGDERLLHNSMAHDLGLGSNPTHEQVHSMIDTLNYKFAMVIITEYYDESLIFLRRQLCWDRSDIVYYPLKVSKASKKGGYAIPSAMRKKIESLNWADTMMYKALNNTLFYRIDHAIGFKEEMEWLQNEKQRVHEMCKQFQGMGDERHRKGILEPDQALEHMDLEEAKQCHLYMMDSPGFVRYLKQTNGVPDPECHSQARFERSAAIVINDVIPSQAGDIIAGTYIRMRNLLESRFSSLQTPLGNTASLVHSAEALAARGSAGNSANRRMLRAVEGAEGEDDDALNPPDRDDDDDGDGGDDDDDDNGVAGNDANGRDGNAAAAGEDDDRKGGRAFGSALVPVTRLSVDAKTLDELSTLFEGGLQRSSNAALVAQQMPMQSGVLSKLPSARIFGIVTSPLLSFYNAFSFLDASALIEEGGGPTGVSFADFLRSPAEFESFLPHKIAGVLKNPLAHALGLPEHLFADYRKTQGFAHKINKQVEKVVVGDYVEESIVFLRRAMCLSEQRATHILPRYPANVQQDLADKDLIEAAALYSPADAALFGVFNKTFWRTIGREINIKVEMKAIAKRSEQEVKQCSKVLDSALSQDQGIAKRSDDELEAIFGDGASSTAESRACHAMTMSLTDMLRANTIKTRGKSGR